MAVTPSKRHVNWTSVTLSLTEPATSSVTLTGVQSVEPDSGGSVITHSGDGDQFPTVKVNDFQDPKITVSARDLNGINSVPVGARGSFSATHLDARNKAQTGGGGYTLTLANCIVSNTTGGGQHRQFGEGKVTLEAESPDGSTNPLTYTSL